MMPPATVAVQGLPIRQRLSDYLILAKPRVVLMVLITTLVGYYLGSADPLDTVRLIHTLVGTTLAASGTMALNQYLERERDAHMVRTRLRPLPARRLLPVEALILGCVVLVGGLAYLTVAVDPLAAGLTATIAAVYLLLYTPLKPVTSLCSIVGAVPGALPPVVGWAAARGQLGLEPWILFAIMFLWQIPRSEERRVGKECRL